jgi:hypothetical protein
VKKQSESHDLKLFTTTPHFLSFYDLSFYQIKPESGTLQGRPPESIEKGQSINHAGEVTTIDRTALLIISRYGRCPPLPAAKAPPAPLAAAEEEEDELENREAYTADLFLFSSIALAASTAARAARSLPIRSGIL